MVAAQSVSSVTSFLHDYARAVANARRPHLKTIVLLFLFGAVFLANSLVRNRDLYQELSAGYALSLYIGGTIALFFDNLFRSVIFRLLLRNHLERISFVNFYLGLLLFGVTDVIAALINIGTPIFVADQNGTNYTSYSIFSLGMLVNMENQPLYFQAIGSVLDLVRLIQICAHSLFLHYITSIRFLHVFGIVTFVHCSIYIIASMVQGFF
jgi:hypothetical protein